MEAKVFLLVGHLHLRVLQVHLVAAAVQFPVDPGRRRARRGTPDDVLERTAERFSLISTLAGDEFNRGIRAYYFGFAAGTWFVSPCLFIAFTLVILAVLWRRDFHSAALRVLSD